MAITQKVVDGKLILEIDIDSKAISAANISKSGKSKLVATTGGFRKIDGSTIQYSLNVIHIDRV
jgi:hypothetical protein